MYLEVELNCPRNCEELTVFLEGFSWRVVFGLFAYWNRFTHCHLIFLVAFEEKWFV